MTDQTPAYQRFFAELKRRRVFRLMAVYGAVAFGVLQAADVLIPALHLPESMITAIAALALLGFPLAIVLAWAFERTPDGITRTPDAVTAEITEIVTQSPGRRWPAGIAAVIGTALLVSGAWWVAGRGGDTGAGPVSGAVPSAGSGAGEASGRDESDYAGSIAVLPFVNMSGDEENEYFSDGLSEELINALVMVDGLKVAARTSAFAFRGQERDVREIGAELGVEHVLEGSVRKAGNRVRITAQLIHADDGFHLWSETYDRQLDDIFAVQEEIAEAITEQLELTLTPDDRDRLARRRTDDLEAYDLYLLGRHNWATRTDEGLVSAQGFFEEAIARDSTFAPAWAGLAAVYDALPWYTDYPVADAAERGKLAARRAIALDSTLAEAYAALGVLLYEFDYDWNGAADAFETARQLDPSYAQGLGWECLFRAIIGEAGAALSVCRLAVEVDPLSMHATWQLASALALDGRVEESLVAFDRAMADRPDVPEIRLDKAGLLLAYDRYDEAIMEYETWLKIEGLDSVGDIRTVVNGIRDPGSRGRAVEALRRLEAPGRIRSFNWVQLWAELGEMEHAMNLLEAAQAEGDPQVLFLGVDPRFELIRDEPVTRRIMAEIGLPTIGVE
jgi:TolB-like protein